MKKLLIIISSISLFVLFSCASNTSAVKQAAEVRSFSRAALENSSNHSNILYTIAPPPLKYRQDQFPEDSSTKNIDIHIAKGESESSKIFFLNTEKSSKNNNSPDRKSVV